MPKKPPKKPPALAVHKPKSVRVPTDAHLRERGFEPRKDQRGKGDHGLVARRWLKTTRNGRLHQVIVLRHEGESGSTPVASVHYTPSTTFYRVSPKVTGRLVFHSRPGWGEAGKIPSLKGNHRHIGPGQVAVVKGSGRSEELRLNPPVEGSHKGVFGFSVGAGSKGGPEHKYARRSDISRADVTWVPNVSNPEDLPEDYIPPGHQSHRSDRSFAHALKG